MSENVNGAFIDIERLVVNRFWLGPDFRGKTKFRGWVEVIQVGTYYLL